MLVSDYIYISSFLVLLGYFRTIFKSYFTRSIKPGVSVLLTKPKDLDYELFIMSKYQSFCRHLLHKKEAQTGTLEQDLALIHSGQLNYTRKMAVVYRSEKKKILHTNIDLCGYIICIIEWLKSKKAGQVTLEEYRERCLEKTEIERQPGLVKRWVYNGDAVFSEEEQYFRRRLCLRGYLKDLAELVGISSETPASSPVVKSEEAAA